MSVHLPRGTKGEALLLLAVAAAAAVVAAVASQATTPPGPVLWGGSGAALALALAGALALRHGGASRRAGDDALYGEWDAARTLLSAIPDGLFLLADGRVSSVNRRLCDLLGFERDELLGASAPLPFWPPEHRHELEAWHAELERHGRCEEELTFRHRNGGRIRVLVAGQRVADGSPRYLVSVRDVSEGHRRERRLAELASRDPETGLLNRREFEERLGEAVRRAAKARSELTVVLAELAIEGRAGAGVFRRPEALLAVERLSALGRAEDRLCRPREGELAWILPDTDVHGAIGAVARLRTDLAALEGVTLTVGICDLATAGDAVALYALADRALDAARREGAGATVRYTPPRPAGTSRPGARGLV